MTIAVLGGRFDPPHWGHVWVARQVLERKKDVAAVWFIPAAQHQWKPTVAGASDRLAMVRKLADEQFFVSDLEIKRAGVSYTIDTIREIKKRWSHTIYWIVGADIVSEFDRWEKREELKREAKFLVFPRDPYHLPRLLPQGFELIDTKDLIVTNVSSTVIRSRIQRGKSIGEFVPEKVEEYIREKGLYKYPL